MQRECDIKNCFKIATHQIKVDDTGWAVCPDCGPVIFELGRKFDDEVNNLKRKYFNLVTEYRKETQNVTTNSRACSKPSDSEGK